MSEEHPVTTPHRPRTVVALGGNAIIRRGDSGTIEEQSGRAREAMRGIADLAQAGHVLVLTHGNGPVVGNILLRSEAARALVPPMPLYIAGADSGGGVGYLLQQTLHNELVARGLSRSVVTIVTQTLVHADDPAFAEPTKPIGPFMTEQDAQAHATERDWTVREQPGGGWRRVVPSPLPLEIVESSAICTLAETGAIVIAAGGGGVPVTRSADGQLAGVDAVVDKDWTGALLACALGADTYIVLMEADAVYRDWGTPDEHRLEHLTAEKVRALLCAGALDTGTIGPKVAASAYAAETCGCTSILCAPEQLSQAMAGEAGTRITRD